MDLHEVASKLKDVRWTIPNSALRARCPLKPDEHGIDPRTGLGWFAASAHGQMCLKGCSSAEVAAWLANGSGVVQSGKTAGLGPANLRSNRSPGIAGSKPAPGSNDKQPEGGDVNARQGVCALQSTDAQPADAATSVGGRAQVNGNGAHGHGNGLNPRPERPKHQSNQPDILRRVPPQNIEAEQSVLGAILLENEAIEEAIRVLKTTDFYRESHRQIFDAMLTIMHKLHAPIDAITLTQELRTRHQLEEIGGTGYIAELAAFVPTAQNIASYARIVRDMATKREIASKATWLAGLAYDGVSLDALMGEMQRTLAPALVVEQNEIIALEDYEAAAEANAEYLRRVPVIDRLCYSSAVSMITGGKHAGKSTLARWMAVCVAKGYDFLKRPVQQGPVLYIASEDETMAARQELIRLGWTRGDNLRFLSASSVKIEDERAFLVRLTSEITRMHAVLVIVDMLFDFIPVQDEMSYAGTREAVGLMQAVATGSGSHIVAIHHAPKNCNIGDAAVAALGSQGLAARVSPIILVRRFGPGVHSISSTSVRDPRGEGIAESKLIKNEDGSVELGGGWKNYMLAEVYQERVKEMLDEDPGVEMTAPEISDGLTISYEVARSCLATMYRNGLVVRSGSGKKGKPYRYSSQISAANAQSDGSKYPTSTGQEGYFESTKKDENLAGQQPFAYKD